MVSEHAITAAAAAVAAAIAFFLGSRLSKKQINEEGHANRHQEAVTEGKVAFCRCWQSSKFPYCDGTHRKLNEAGDSVGPVVVFSNPADMK